MNNYQFPLPITHYPFGLRHLLQRNAICSWGKPRHLLRTAGTSATQWLSKTAMAREPPSGFSSRPWGKPPRPRCFTATQWLTITHYLFPIPYSLRFNATNISICVKDLLGLVAVTPIPRMELRMTVASGVGGKKRFANGRAFSMFR